MVFNYLKYDLMIFKYLSTSKIISVNTGSRSLRGHPSPSYNDSQILYE